jgi:AraC-like DNA-binding protein
METERFSTRDVPVRQRADRWSSILADVHFRNTFAPRDAHSFEGTMVTRRLGRHHLAMVDASPARLVRSRLDAARDSRNDFIISACLEGAFSVAQRDTRIALRPGEVAVVDTSTAFAFSHDVPLRVLSLHVSRTLAAAACPSLLGAELQTIPIESMRRRIGFRLLGVLFEESTGDVDVIDVDDAILLLLRTFDAGRSADTAQVSTHQAKLLVRAERVMRANLAATLHTDAVAEELGISTSYLQKLFRIAGTTFALRLRSLRLERAQILLRERHLTGASVTDIMFACGFQSPEYFSRAYRSRFGHPPSAVAPSGPSSDGKS